MISIHCGLYLPASLKPLLQNPESLIPKVTVQCEFGLLKNNENHPGAQKEEGEMPFWGNEEKGLESLKIMVGSEEGSDMGRSGSWDSYGLKKLWEEGRKLLLEELRVTLSLVIEFPTEDEHYAKDRSSQNSQNLIFAESVSEPERDSIIKKERSQNLELARRCEVEEVKPELVKEVEQIVALNNTKSLQLCSEGIGGTYFIHNSTGQKIAVFKPTDEEPGAALNPKGPISNPLLPPGGGAIREVAAYLLDKGFAGVPETYLASNIQHPIFKSSGVPKSGSLQRYIENIEHHDMSSSRFSVDDVHKMGILDVRLFNMDRNSENYLIIQNQPQLPNSNCPKLVPIDHSYILPPSLSFVWFEWLHWKQAKAPFQKAHLEYIESLDIAQDAALLQQLGFEKESIQTMVISTTFLKIAALKFGFNLFQIGSMLSRKKLTEESELERIVQKAYESSGGGENSPFIDILSTVITEELQNKIQK